MLEELPYLATFPAKLPFVAEVLILAATACRKERAVRLLSVRAGSNDSDEVAMRTTDFVFPDPGLHSFPGQAEGHENHPPVDTAHTGSKVGEGVDLELNDVMITKGFRAKMLWGIEIFTHELELLGFAVKISF